MEKTLVVMVVVRMILLYKIIVLSFLYIGTRCIWWLSRLYFS